MISYEEVTADKKGKKRFDEVSIEDATPYACEDADITLMACEVLKPKLEEGGLSALFQEIEMPQKLSGILGRNSGNEKFSAPKGVM